MSTQQNEEWLEDKYQEFHAGDVNVQEAIITELREEGFIDKADYLEQKIKESDVKYGEDKDNFE